MKPRRRSRKPEHPAQQGVSDTPSAVVNPKALPEQACVPDASPQQVPIGRPISDDAFRQLKQQHPKGTAHPQHEGTDEKSPETLTSDSQETRHGSEDIDETTSEDEH